MLIFIFIYVIFQILFCRFLNPSMLIFKSFYVNLYFLLCQFLNECLLIIRYFYVIFQIFLFLFLFLGPFVEPSFLFFEIFHWKFSPEGFINPHVRLILRYLYYPESGWLVWSHWSYSVPKQLWIKTWLFGV